MSIVTFWNNGTEQTGKTLSIAAIATHLAIEHNYRILVGNKQMTNKALEGYLAQTLMLECKKELLD